MNQFHADVLCFVKEGANPPFKKIKEDAGWDLSAHIDEHLHLNPGDCKKISLGIALDSPAGLQWLLDVRSSIGVKGLSLMCRIVDSSYRGIIHAVLCNCGNDPVVVSPGERICQMVPMPFSTEINVIAVSNMNNFRETERGDQGFGSSGRF